MRFRYFVCGTVEQTYGVGELGGNVWANGDLILEESLVGDIWSEFQNMAV